MRLWNRVPERVAEMLPAGCGPLLAHGQLELPMGGLAAATQHLIVWSTGDPSAHAGPICVAWDEVDTARWSQESLDLVQRDAAGSYRHHRLQFKDPGMIPEVVRERISWTVVASHALTVSDADSGNRRVLLTARRSTRDAAVRWVATFEPQSGPVTAAQARAAALAGQQLAAQLGIG